jgi:hypothetical protein
MARVKRLVSIAAAPLLIAAPAPAAPAPTASSSPEILVVGDRDANQARREYVRAMALPSADDRLARFMTPVCPYVAGLTDKANAFMVERLRKVAAASGMHVARESCAPNAVLFIVPDKAGLIRHWLRSNWEMFGDDMTQGQIEPLAASPEPTASWQILEVHGSDGRALARQRLTMPGGVDATNGVIMVPFALGSRFMNETEFSFGASVLVVDSHAIAGADLRQVADFAAMQLFAHTSPKMAAAQSAPTILTLIQDTAAGRPSPLSLTEWDFAYLRALYSSTNMYRAGAHRGEIARRMAKYMTQDGRR